MGRLDFIYKMDLPHRAYVVYLYLYDRANKDGICWPSVNRIAEDTKLSPSTVRRAIKDLRKAELVRTEQRYRVRGEYSSLLYILKEK
jgi:GntR family transcriptional regulator